MEVPPLCRVGLATETVGHVFDVDVKVTTDHYKPRLPPALGNAATGDFVFRCRLGRLEGSAKQTQQQVRREAIRVDVGQEYRQFFWVL